MLENDTNYITNEVVAIYRASQTNSKSNSTYKLKIRQQ